MSTHHHRHRHQRASDAKNTQMKAGEDRSIRLRAYEIYCEKGGRALDNWLEAEQTVKNNQ